MKLKKRSLIGWMMIGLVLLATFLIHQQQQLNQQKKRAEQTTLDFFEAMSKGDSATAFQYVWRAEQFNIKPESSIFFKDLQVLEVINIRPDSAQARPAYYTQFHQLLSVMLKVKSVYPDDAGSPPGHYILFVSLAKESPDSEWLITEIGTGP